MSHDDRDPTDRDPLVLLRALGSSMPAPPAAVRHVLDRLVTTLPSGAWETAAPPSGTSAPTARNVFGNGVVAVARPWAWVVGLTVGGAVMGGIIHALFAPEKIRVVYVDPSPSGRSVGTESSARGAADDRKAATPAEAQNGSAAALAAKATGGLTPPEPLRVPSDRASTGGAPAADSNWAKERALLDTARRALTSGESAACLAELGKHARAFPSGKLAEEREALAINALVGVGRYPEARRRAEIFARRYPHSFLAPSVEAAISVIP